MKKIAAVMLLGGLMLVGAGCAEEPKPTNNNTTTPPANNTPTDTVPTTSNNNEPVGEFTLSGEATVMPGQVKLQWSAPSDMGPNDLFHLTHSAQPDKTAQNGAFWQNVGASTRDFMWDGMKSGKRYFRVCVMKENKCTQTSNEIEVTVK